MFRYWYSILKCPVIGTFTLAPCDFWMCPKLKMALKGKRFDDIETIQSNATRELKVIPNSAFKDCFKRCEQTNKVHINKLMENLLL